MKRDRRKSGKWNPAGGEIFVFSNLSDISDPESPDEDVQGLDDLRAAAGLAILQTLRAAQTDPTVNSDERAHRVASKTVKLQAATPELVEH